MGGFEMRLWLTGMTAIGMVAQMAQAAAPETASIVVHADQPGPQVNRQVFGQFAEHLGHGIYGGIWVGPKSPIPNIHGYRRDVVDALKDIAVPFVRWPGGCFADTYRWRGAIGPQAKRSVLVNSNWGGVTEDNSFGTNEYFGFLDLIGAESYVSANVGSVPAAEVSEWVEYMTSPTGSSLAKERAANGLLLYLNHAFQAHTALGEFSVAAGVARRFEEVFATLPANLSAIKENKEMRIQLRYNAGLALEKTGQAAEALGQLEAAAALVDAEASALGPGRHVPLRSEVCSALGNLLVSQRELDRASAWHARAVENEELAEGSGPRKWGVYHAAASCAAMRGDFLRAVEWDTRAIDMMQQQANPRVHFNRGLCLQKLNQWGESVADFTRVVALDPANVKGFVLRAKALLRQERWADVVADCDAALKLAPQDAQSREFKEFALQRLG